MGKTAFVLSGGANLGALQVGMLRALAEAGVQPDLIVGSSVGALNGSWIASEFSTERVHLLAELWLSLRRRDIFPLKFTLGLRGFVGRHEALFDSTGVAQVIENNVGFGRLEDAPIPLVVVATDLLTGHDVAFDSGSAVDTILASSAIPGVFPPVTVNGRLFMDGSVSNNAPVSHAVQRGADRIFVLPTGYDCPVERPPSSVLGMLLHALSVMVDQQLAGDIERYAGDVDLVVLPTPCPLDVNPGDFNHTAELIDRSYELSVDAIVGETNTIKPADR